MHCNIAIRASNSSYQIYPIEEQDESQEEFVPYIRQRYQIKCQLSDSLHKARTKSENSQSIDSKQARLRLKLMVRLRVKSINHSVHKGLTQTHSLHIASHKQQLPSVIHSKKNLRPPLLQKQSPSKKRLAKLQTDMKQHKPAFFKEKQSMAGESRNISRRLNLQVLSRSNFFLFDIPNKPKEQVRELPISRKELRRIMQVQRMESTMMNPAIMKSTISQELPPKLTRSQI